MRTNEIHVCNVGTAAKRAEHAVFWMKSWNLKKSNINQEQLQLTAS